MANETQNKEFNKAIKQLQAMVRDKQIINLAEKFYNLKIEMSTLTRNVKEKESALILEQAKLMSTKTEIKAEEPSVVFEQPKPEIIEQPKPQARAQQPVSQNKQRNDFRNDNRNNFQRNNQNQLNQNNRYQGQVYN